MEEAETAVGIEEPIVRGTTDAAVDDLAAAGAAELKVSDEIVLAVVTGTATLEAKFEVALSLA